MTPSVIEGFQEFHFPEPTGRRVFRRGTGPGVLIMHELPGLTPQCEALANRIAAAGFTAYVPLLFRQPGNRRVVSVFSGCASAASSTC